MIGRLERIPLREVWKHEALDFTKWLRDNSDVLSDVIDVPISNLEREQSAGAFSVDLLGEDESGNAIIIENQLEKSDHDHLGKLITYLAAFEAKTAIWIVSDPRPEHVAAVAWLNQSTPASFYLLKVEAVRIGDSPPAPFLTRIVGPSAESREVGQHKQEVAERHSILRHFWTTLLDRARSRTSLHTNISPSRDQWITASAGTSGLGFTYVVTQRDSRVEFTINRADAEWNKRIFDQLHAHQQEIDQRFGEPLDWQRLDEKKMCRIEKRVENRGYRVDEEQWPEIQEAMIAGMIRLENALRPYIDQLRT